MEELSAGTTAALAGLIGGIVLGFCARWGRFCTLNAIEGAVLGGDDSGLRSWGLAIASATIGAFALDQAGLIDISASFYTSSPTTLLATITGGLLFGLGMAFVGTCGYGCLARIGGGDLKSVVTFLVMGISAYATLRGATAYIRVALFPTPEAADTPASFAYAAGNWLGIGPHWAAYIFALVMIGLCFSSAQFRSQHKKIAIGILVGLVIAWGWFATGNLAVDEFDPYPLESYTFSAPLGETLIYFMTMTGSSLKFGIGAVIGVIVGAAVTSIAQTHFRWEACDDAREMRRQILGGFLMGVGSVTALGCTIGQGVSAASLLAFSAPVALVSIFVGAWIGLQILIDGSMMGPFRALRAMMQQH
ncbi:MAG: YeeE/YedE family protein [Rhizobiaceae bacterium]